MLVSELKFKKNFEFETRGDFFMNNNFTKYVTFRLKVIIFF